LGLPVLSSTPFVSCVRTFPSPDTVNFIRSCPMTDARQRDDGPCKNAHNRDLERKRTTKRCLRSFARMCKAAQTATMNTAKLQMCHTPGVVHEHFRSSYASVHFVNEIHHRSARGAIRHVGTCGVPVMSHEPCVADARGAAGKGLAVRSMRAAVGPPPARDGFRLCGLGHRA
jgi:hypothetical protein